MDIHERFEIIISDLGWSKLKFEKYIGKSPGYLGVVKKQGSMPSMDVITTVLDKFPQYSADWLVMGRGSKTGSSISVEENGITYGNEDPLKAAQRLVKMHTDRLNNDINQLLEDNNK